MFEGTTKPVLSDVDTAESDRAPADSPRTAQVHAGPRGAGDDFSGPTRFDKLFTAVTCTPAPAWLAAGDRRGLEDTGPEDTFDGDYGRLLDRAYGKSARVLASPRETDPLLIAIDRWIAA